MVRCFGVGLLVLVHNIKNVFTSNELELPT